MKALPIRVLLVEDEPLVAELLILVLTNSRRADFNVFQVSRIQQAENLVREHTYDVGVIDLGLPDGDGLEVLSRLRSLVEMPLVVVTGRNESPSDNELLLNYSEGVFYKPRINYPLLERFLCLVVAERRCLAEHQKEPDWKTKIAKKLKAIWRASE